MNFHEMKALISFFVVGTITFLTSLFPCFSFQYLDGIPLLHVSFFWPFSNGRSQRRSLASKLSFGILWSVLFTKLGWLGLLSLS